jgi:hypothetical protein
VEEAVSAVDDYLAASTVAWSQDKGMVPGVLYDALTKADTAIAELKAELHYEKLSNRHVEAQAIERAIKAEAELEALKGRHKDAMACIPESVQVHLRNRWTAREETP